MTRFNYLVCNWMVNIDYKSQVFFNFKEASISPPVEQRIKKYRSRTKRNILENTNTIITYELENWSSI